MKISLEKMKVILNAGIIILLVISIVSIILCCKDRQPLSRSEINRLKDGQTLVFYNITTGKDTCLVSDFLDGIYDDLNIKFLDWDTFTSYFMDKVVKGKPIEVSEEYYQEHRNYSISKVETISNIYDNYGLDSTLNYLYKYPINQLFKDDMTSFDWAAYILWQNGIYVSLDDEILWWYIDADGYRY